MIKQEEAEIEEQAKEVKSTREEILEPFATDVICGRGGLSNHHPGNEWYRRLIKSNRPLYRACPKHTKLLVSKAIVQAVEQQGGRFLEKSKTHHLWYIVNYKRAVDKTSQGLREREDDDGILVGQVPAGFGGDKHAKESNLRDLANVAIGYATQDPKMDNEMPVGTAKRKLAVETTIAPTMPEPKRVHFEGKNPTASVENAPNGIATAPLIKTESTETLQSANEVSRDDDVKPASTALDPQQGHNLKMTGGLHGNSLPLQRGYDPRLLPVPFGAASGGPIRSYSNHNMIMYSRRFHPGPPLPPPAMMYAAAARQAASQPHPSLNNNNAPPPALTRLTTQVSDWLTHFWPVPPAMYMNAPLPPRPPPPPPPPPPVEVTRQAALEQVNQNAARLPTVKTISKNKKDKKDIDALFTKKRPNKGSGAATRRPLLSELPHITTLAPPLPATEHHVDDTAEPLFLPTESCGSLIETTTFIKSSESSSSPLPLKEEDKSMSSPPTELEQSVSAILLKLASTTVAAPQIFSGLTPLFGTKDSLVSTPATNQNHTNTTTATPPSARSSLLDDFEETEDEVRLRTVAL